MPDHLGMCRLNRLPIGEHGHIVEHVTGSLWSKEKVFAS